MDEKISKLFLPLLDKLYNTEPAGEPFRKPVDVVKYGCYDYYLYIKHPIDLSTIRENLTSHKYKDAWRFVADIHLMFSNAYLFNKKGTPVYEFTNKLNKIWNQELAPIMQRLNYCCGTLHKFGPQLLFCHGTTPDRYCQIPIGAKYKCYQDQYSFCMPCFNKIDSDHVNIQSLSCETARMKLPTQPVKKSDFADCANDNWQYESFIQCTQCSRRVHQICDAYPASEEEIASCKQHAQIEHEQKMLCQVPEEYRSSSSDNIENSTSQSCGSSSGDNSKQQDSATSSMEEETTTTTTTATTTFETTTTDTTTTTTSTSSTSDRSSSQDEEQDQEQREDETHQRDEAQTIDDQRQQQETVASSTSLDDELLQFARDVDDLTNSAPVSPSAGDESRYRADSSAKESCHKRLTNFNNNSNSGDRSDSRSAFHNHNNNGPCNGAKNSVDNIAARLSINKMTAEAQAHELQKQNNDATISSRDKFVCNHCYRKKRVGFNLRHRKYSARRLPHTRMSKYIETKVNEHIRENSPTAGEVTIRVLTAYRDTITVKPEMREYVNKIRQRENSSQQHPNIKDYPEEFGYTNRAIFAWQEIDGVDVCVFGMHVQEYGEDCPEPNRQVIYLSYLDSVHFFRPKQVRTAVYHEILLSYFKYVKKLGYRRVFIWVCPSRKGDDYIFYRHPTEQKMPTLKRLSDWYVDLLDKGIHAGIVERHHNIYQYSQMQNWQSILNIPYLSGDFWPGEFERLLKIMIESQEQYQAKLSQHGMQQERKELESARPLDISDIGDRNRMNNSYFNNTLNDLNAERHNMLALTGVFQKQQILPNPSNGKIFNLKSNTIGLKPSNTPSHSICFTPDGDLGSNLSAVDDSRHLGSFTPDSLRSDYDQPLDLSKSSTNTSPESYFDDDRISELSYKTTNNRKRRRKSSSIGCTKRRGRISSSQNLNTRANRPNQVMALNDPSHVYSSQPSKYTRQKLSTYTQKDSLASEILLTPEDELIKNLERSLKRQKEGFIVVRLNECDCPPNFENQRRREETTLTCDLMKGREPFLQLARLKNYEFSTLRRAKFSSLAMVKHLGQYFKLEPICNECFSFDSSKRHFACPHCDDYYLCTSCHENTHHDHIMSLMAPSTLPDIDEFLQQCSLASTTNSISSASSTISNKSFNDSTIEVPSQSVTPTLKKNVSTILSSSSSSSSSSQPSAPLAKHLSNTLGSSSMPLGCQRQKNRDFAIDSRTRAEDEENSDISFNTPTSKMNSLPVQPSPPPSHSSNNIRGVGNHSFDMDQVLVENFIRHAEVTFAFDFDQMKNESKKLLTHYWVCPSKETCHRCKFVVLSLSFSNVVMRSPRMQMMINCNPSEIMPSNTNSNNSHPIGINLTTAHQFSYQPKDK